MLLSEGTVTATTDNVTDDRRDTISPLLLPAEQREAVRPPFVPDNRPNNMEPQTI